MPYFLAEGGAYEQFVKFEFLNPIVYQGKDLDKAGITCNYNNNRNRSSEIKDFPIEAAKRAGLINHIVYDTDL